MTRSTEIIISRQIFLQHEAHLEQNSNAGGSCRFSMQNTRLHKIEMRDAMPFQCTITVCLSLYVFRQKDAADKTATN